MILNVSTFMKRMTDVHIQYELTSYKQKDFLNGMEESSLTLNRKAEPHGQ